MFNIFKKKSDSQSFAPSSPRSTAFSSQSSLSNDEQHTELAPIIVLLGAQSSRVYVEGIIDVSVEHRDYNDLQYQPTQATIRGNSLLLSTPKSISLDLLEATIKVVPEHLSILLSTSNRVAYHLRLPSLETLQQWVSSIHLTNYEYTRLNEIYTASMLSAKATQLSDVHVVMSELKYNKEEWVNIKFNKNSQWLRCFAVISPGSSKSKGTMNFYSSTRTSKRNLICSMTNVDYCHFVYPYLPELINQSSLIKLSGDLQIYNLGQQSETSSPQATPKGHNRTSSISSTTSFGSISSVKSSKGVPVHQSAMYIMPLTHGGVKPYETMMRLLIPVYDCFKLYGRPSRLIPDKRDPNSLLFGLPSLPNVKILSSEVAFSLIQDSWAMVSRADVDFMLMFQTQLKSIYSNDPTYQGTGNLKNNRDSMFENPFAQPDLSHSEDQLITPNNEFNTPDSTPKYAMSISDLPLGLSTEDVDKIQRAQKHKRSGSSASMRVGSLRDESFKNLNVMNEVEDADVTITV
jgi:hypothetical protein